MVKMVLVSEQVRHRVAMVRRLVLGAQLEIVYVLSIYDDGALLHV